MLTERVVSTRQQDCSRHTLTRVAMPSLAPPDDFEFGLCDFMHDPGDGALDAWYASRVCERRALESLALDDVAMGLARARVDLVVCIRMRRWTDLVCVRVRVCFLLVC